MHAPQCLAKVSHVDHQALSAAAWRQGSPALLCRPHGRPAYISGIPGFDAQGALPDGFEAQFANVVTNIKRVLDEAGATFRDLVKLNVLLTRAADVAIMNKLYADAFGPAPYPARTTCVVVALPGPRMLIEIEGVAQLAK